MKRKTNQATQGSEGSVPAPTELNSIRLGQVLVRVGRIKAEDLEKALSEQDASKKRIGEILVEKGFIKLEELTHGLNVQSMLTTSGISAGISFGSVLEGKPSRASEEKKAEPVKTQVPVRSHLAVLYQLSSVTISRADIKAGYIILEKATRIAIKSNNKKGCMVVFKGLKWPFKEAHAFGFAHDAHITPEGGSVRQAYRKNTQQVELSYRLILSENARPGKHPWPLSLAIQPV